MRFLVRKLSQGVSAVVTLAASAGLLTDDTKTAQQTVPSAPAVAVATPAPAPAPLAGQGATALSGSAAQVAAGVSLTMPRLPVAPAIVPPTPSQDR